MLRIVRRKWIVIAVGVIVVFGLAITITTIYVLRLRKMREEAAIPSQPEAPPDLEKLREPFVSGAAAILRNDGPDAIRHLSSFTFGPRSVEEYRLYYLAGGYQLAGQPSAARVTLTRLWRRNPKLLYASEAGLQLANLHAAAGSFHQSREAYRDTAFRTQSPETAGTARWMAVESSFVGGDVGALLESARLIGIRSPRSPQAGAALGVVRSLYGISEGEAIPLTHAERLERAVSLLRDGGQQSALQELTALEPDAPPHMKLPIQLNRGLALFQLRRFDEANRVLEPLTSTYYKYSIPAIYHLAKSYRILAASIDPTVTKVVTERKKVGTVKVRVGKGKTRRTVTRPKYANVKKTIKLVDLAKKAKKESYEGLATERLKDLLQLPLADEVRVQVLSTLIGIAQAKSQDDYAQDLVRQLIRVDPLQDAALQYFWDKAWAAYSRGDLGNASPLFLFISEAYRNPNVRRQAEYWFARSIERQGRREEAAAIYQRLASAPYTDLYAMHSVSHGAKREEATGNPLHAKRPDWPEIAEREMPAELRLAYELTALTDFRDARLEIQKNMSGRNTHFADALLADLYHSTGNPVLMSRSARRAFPELATIEQDKVPPYFIKMYYPIKYEVAVRKYAERNGLDPYLVMGLILQESYYDPRARSRAGATGLMQLMAPTAKEIAQRLRIPFGAARLENPEVNIQLGTYHLKGLINLFGGNVYLAVASYNAGQGNVLRWRRAARNRPLDEFLESIPFPETRNYVKRVMMLRSRYARIAS